VRRSELESLLKDFGHLPGPKHSNSQQQEDAVLEPREWLPVVLLVLLSIAVLTLPMIRHEEDWSVDILFDRTGIAERLVVLLGILVKHRADAVEGGSGLHGSDRMTTHRSRAIVVALMVEEGRITASRIRVEEFSLEGVVNTACLIHLDDLTLLIQAVSRTDQLHSVTT
jgi:hypothetical protein